MSMPIDPGTSAPARVPIMESVREGFAFVARDWRAILPVAVIGAVGVGGLQILTDLARARQDMGVAVLCALASVVVQVVLIAALLRRALSQGETPAMPRLGRDEANLLGAVFSLGFLYFILGVFALIFISMCLGALAVGAKLDPNALSTLPPEEAARQFFAALGTDGTLVLCGLVLGFTGFFLWIAARVILSYPATIASGRMFIFSTWEWTKGHGLRLMACLFLLVVVGIFLGVVALAPIGLALNLVFGAGAQLNAASPAHWIVAVLSGFVSVMFSTAPYAGMGAYLYRGLRPAQIA